MCIFRQLSVCIFMSWVACKSKLNSCVSFKFSGFLLWSKQWLIIWCKCNFKATDRGHAAKFSTWCISSLLVKVSGKSGLKCGLVLWFRIMVSGWHITISDNSAETHYNVWPHCRHITMSDHSAETHYNVWPQCRDALQCLTTVQRHITMSDHSAEMHYNVWPQCRDTLQCLTTLQTHYNVWPHCRDTLQCLTTLQTHYNAWPHCRDTLQCLTTLQKHITIFWPHCRDTLQYLTTLQRYITMSDHIAEAHYNVWPHCRDTLQCLTTLQTHYNVWPHCRHITLSDHAADEPLILPKI